jgi:hypothetical protein
MKFYRNATSHRAAALPRSRARRHTAVRRCMRTPRRARDRRSMRRTIVTYPRATRSSLTCRPGRSTSCPLVRPHPPCTRAHAEASHRTYNLNGWGSLRGEAMPPCTLAAYKAPPLPPPAWDDAPPPPPLPLLTEFASPLNPRADWPSWPPS